MSLRLPRSNPNKKRGRREKTPPSQVSSDRMDCVVVSNGRGGSLELGRNALELALDQGLIPDLSGPDGPRKVAELYEEKGWGNPTDRPFWKKYMRHVQG